MKNHDHTNRTTRALSIVIIVGFFAVLFILLVFVKSPEAYDAVRVMIGQLSIAFILVVRKYIGDKQKKDKE